MKIQIIFFFFITNINYVIAHNREMFLNGGGAKICSSFTPEYCQFNSLKKPYTPSYKINEKNINSLLKKSEFLAVSDLRSFLTNLKQKHNNQILSLDVMDSLPWPNNLLDSEKYLIYSAFELPSAKVKININNGTSNYGAEFYKEFVAAAKKRSSQKRPKIAIVTASQNNSFERVDYLKKVFEQAGAQALWWPIDQTMKDAIFNHQDCESLSKLRLEISQLLNGDYLYPEIAKFQRKSCKKPDELANIPFQVQGIFFAGGDQWLIHEALFGPNEVPNLWMQNLTKAFNLGKLVVSGSSAGTAVQAGVAMITNGSSYNAINRGSKIMDIPIPEGCDKAKRCPAGFEENDFTYWPPGGLKLAGEIITDTHFSERARQVRLLQLMHDTNTSNGFGIDENSTFHLKWIDSYLEIEVLGESGGWWFSLLQEKNSSNHIKAKAHYLAPGRILEWKDGSLNIIGKTKTVIDSSIKDCDAGLDALEKNIIRDTAQKMARLGIKECTLKASNAILKLSLSQETKIWSNDPGLLGISNLSIEIIKEK